MPIRGYPENHVAHYNEQAMQHWFISQLPKESSQGLCYGVHCQLSLYSLSKLMSKLGNWHHHWQSEISKTCL